MIKHVTLALVAALCAASTASAHITLEQNQATSGKAYKAVLRVGHGCEGKSTIKVRVKIPEGLLSAKPMPKPGWTTEKARANYEKSYDLYGKPVNEGVTEIVWTGGTLADDEYDEFVFRATVAKEIPLGTRIYVPVVQECTDGAVERWIEIPAAGKSSDDYETPAPYFDVIEQPRT
ncbi:YcnI family copper-binding membrane protein [Rhizobium sp. LjRoot258]|uniref:YcnI family copper-binding membrane protein n=1 Tax=Rhizobium sp. LjRoot258 TaxID=3342299 RepID=UPI003ECC72FB